VAFLYVATALVDGASYASEPLAKQGHTSADAELNRALLDKQKEMNVIFQNTIEAQLSPDREEDALKSRQFEEGETDSPRRTYQAQVEQQQDGKQARQEGKLRL
jgi:hypothetical protein